MKRFKDNKIEYENCYKIEAELEKTRNVQLTAEAVIKQVTFSKLSNYLEGSKGATF